MDTVLIAVMLRRRRDQHRASRRSCVSSVGTERLATIIMHLPVKGVKVGVDSSLCSVKCDITRDVLVLRQCPGIFLRKTISIRIDAVMGEI